MAPQVSLLRLLVKRYLPILDTSKLRNQHFPQAAHPSSLHHAHDNHHSSPRACVPFSQSQLQSTSLTLQRGISQPDIASRRWNPAPPLTRRNHHVHDISSHLLALGFQCWEHAPSAALGGKSMPPAISEHTRCASREMPMPPSGPLQISRNSSRPSLSRTSRSAAG